MFSTFAWFFLSLNGRISRQEFRLGYFGLAIVDILLVRTWRNITLPPVRYYSGADINPPYDGSVPLARLIMLWPMTAILVKRLHDMNISGWWWLPALVLIPLVASAIGINAAIPHLLIFAFLSLFPGATGDNRFGGDPLARAKT
jgi:uncharacterized membrane protein YhaH (DUF805 family)